MLLHPLCCCIHLCLCSWPWPWLCLHIQICKFQVWFFIWYGLIPFICETFHTQLFISYVEISYIIGLFYMWKFHMQLFFSYVEISYVITHFTYERIQFHKWNFHRWNHMLNFTWNFRKGLHTAINTADFVSWWMVEPLKYSVIFSQKHVVTFLRI